MHDELVKRLRELQAITEHCGEQSCGECENRELCDKYDNKTLSGTYKEAADAIEELNKQIENGHKAYKAVYHNLAARIPHWISVKDRLPEEPYGCLLVVWDSPQNGGDDFLNYLPYFAGWDGEQWNDADGEQVPFEVVYWRPLQPLPEPPKEEA